MAFLGQPRSSSTSGDSYEEYDYYSYEGYSTSDDEDLYSRPNQQPAVYGAPPGRIAPQARATTSTEISLAHLKVWPSVVGIVLGKQGANIKATQRAHAVHCDFMDANKGRCCPIQRGGHCLHISGPLANVKSAVAAINSKLRAIGKPECGTAEYQGLKGDAAARVKESAKRASQQRSTLQPAGVALPVVPSIASGVSGELRVEGVRTLAAPTRVPAAKAVPAAPAPSSQRPSGVRGQPGKTANAFAMLDASEDESFSDTEEASGDEDRGQNRDEITPQARSTQPPHSVQQSQPGQKSKAATKRARKKAAAAAKKTGQATLTQTQQAQPASNSCAGEWEELTESPLGRLIAAEVADPLRGRSVPMEAFDTSYRRLPKERAFAMLLAAVQRGASFCLERMLQLEFQTSPNHTWLGSASMSTTRSRSFLDCPKWADELIAAAMAHRQLRLVASLLRHSAVLSAPVLAALSTSPPALLEALSTEHVQMHGNGEAGSSCWCVSTTWSLRTRSLCCAMSNREHTPGACRCGQVPCKPCKSS